MLVVWATYVLLQRPKLSAVCDWLSWLTCVPVDQSQTADSLGRWHSTYVIRHPNTKYCRKRGPLPTVTNIQLLNEGHGSSLLWILHTKAVVLYIVYQQNPKVLVSKVGNFSTVQTSRLHRKIMAKMRKDVYYSSTKMGTHLLKLIYSSYNTHVFIGHENIIHRQQP